MKLKYKLKTQTKTDTPKTTETRYGRRRPITALQRYNEGAAYLNHKVRVTESVKNDSVTSIFASDGLLHQSDSYTSENKEVYSPQSTGLLLASLELLPKWLLYSIQHSSSNRTESDCSVGVGMVSMTLLTWTYFSRL